VEEPIYYKKPHRFFDERGFFQEIYNGSRTGESSDGRGPLPSAMVQINHSRSKKGVLRGMHWQQPNPVGKYVTCIHGRILDVVVDIRRSSPAFKQWRGYEIDAEQGQSLWVPEGYAHGFVVISPMADVLYAQSAAFDPSGDRVLRWNDPDVGIKWPEMLKKYTISDKDKNAPLLSELPEEVLFD
tara:strand:- start:2705 stop:3256 length:552 start_codon:yes stop_codon:yes gene_type:complete